MKQWLLAIVVLMSVGMLTTGCSKARKVETGQLNTEFANASAETKGKIQQALDGIKARDFTTALVALKDVAETPDLTEEQKQALSDTVTDITVIISENPPENSDELFDHIADITDALLQ